MGKLRSGAIGVKFGKEQAAVLKPLARDTVVELTNLRTSMWQGSVELRASPKTQATVVPDGGQYPLEDCGV